MRGRSTWLPSELSRAKSYPFVKKRCVYRRECPGRSTRNAAALRVRPRHRRRRRSPAIRLPRPQRADVPNSSTGLTWSWFSHYRQHYSLLASGSATQMSSPPAGSALHASAELTADTGPRTKPIRSQSRPIELRHRNSLTTGVRMLDSLSGADRHACPHLSAVDRIHLIVSGVFLRILRCNAHTQEVYMCISDDRYIPRAALPRSMRRKTPDTIR